MVKKQSGMKGVDRPDEEVVFPLAPGLGSGLLGVKALDGCSGGGGGGKGQKTAAAASVDAANAKQATKYRGRKSWREKEEGAREDNYSTPIFGQGAQPTLQVIP